MITSCGPGINPMQLAIIRTRTARRVTPVYYSPKYITRQQLDASGWSTSDPVFFEACNGARPQGAIEMSWVQALVLDGTSNHRLPRIAQSQVRYISARVYVTLVGALASKLDSVRAVFTEADVGSSTGLGLTSYGPETLPFQLDLTDHRGRREHYTVEMLVHPTSTLQQFVQGKPHALLSRQMELFSNGGVEFHLTWTPLSQQGRKVSLRSKSFDMLLPLDPMRIILRQQQHTTHANGRLAALL